MFCGNEFKCRTQHHEIEDLTHEEMHRQRFENLSLDDKVDMLETIRTNLMRYHTKLLLKGGNEETESKIRTMCLKAAQLAQSLDSEDEDGQ